MKDDRTETLKVRKWVAYSVLSALFVIGSPPPPAPNPDCGVDPTLDALGCDMFSPCP